MTDFLDALPADDYPLPSHDEEMLNRMIIPDRSTIHSAVEELRPVLVAGIVFLMLTSDFARDIIEGWIPYARSSSTSLVITKTILFMVVLFVIHNAHLVIK